LKDLKIHTKLEKEKTWYRHTEVVFLNLWLWI